MSNNELDGVEPRGRVYIYIYIAPPRGIELLARSQQVGSK